MQRLMLLFVFSLLLTFPLQVSAGGFYLKTIGDLNVEGTSFDQYWYSGESPTLRGVAPAASAVSVEVNQVPADSVVADEDGNWSQAIALIEGDNSVTISANGVSPYSFTLTKGTPPEGIGGIEASDMPQAGVGLPTIFLLSLGLLAIATPAFAFRRN